MAKVTGIIMTCDRCYKKKIYSDGPFGKGADTAHIEGWTRQFDKDLCPDCTVAYDDLLSNFFAYVREE